MGFKEWVDGKTKGFIEPKGSRRRERVRGEYRFVESLTLLSQRLNARGGDGELMK